MKSIKEIEWIHQSGIEIREDAVRRGHKGKKNKEEIKIKIKVKKEPPARKGALGAEQIHTWGRKKK